MDEAERHARYALRKACNGWRNNHICIDAATGRPRPEPHPACLRAQQQHDFILAMSNEPRE